MHNPRLEKLRSEFDAANTGYEAIMTRAASESRDPSESEQADADKLLTRMAELGKEVEASAKVADSVAETAKILARIAPTTADTSAGATAAPAYTRPAMEARVSTGARNATVYREAADYVGTLVRSMHNDPDAKRELDILTRSSQTTSDTPGVIPETIVGDIQTFVDANRYAVNACTRYSMPAVGKKFERPKLVSGTTVAEQSDGAATPTFPGETGVLANGKLDIESDEVTKHTYGGYVNVSQQDLDWAQVDLMQVILTDLARRYAIQTDQVTTAAIVAAAASHKTTLASNAVNGVYVTALANASSAVYTRSGQLADTLFASPDQWVRIVSMTSASTDTLTFPFLNPVNAAGSASGGVVAWSGGPLGLKLIVDPNFASGTLIVANTAHCEVYEQLKGQLQVTNVPAVNLTTSVGYAGYFATLIKSEAVQNVAP